MRNSSLDILHQPCAVVGFSFNGAVWAARHHGSALPAQAGMFWWCFDRIRKPTRLNRSVRFSIPETSIQGLNSTYPLFLAQRPLLSAAPIRELLGSESLNTSGNLPARRAGVPRWSPCSMPGKCGPILPTSAKLAQGELVQWPAAHRLHRAVSNPKGAPVIRPGLSKNLKGCRTDGSPAYAALLGALNVVSQIAPVFRYFPLYAGRSV
jgi:hypothetical protein